MLEPGFKHWLTLQWRCTHGKSGLMFSCLFQKKSHMPNWVLRAFARVRVEGERNTKVCDKSYVLSAWLVYA